MGESLVRASTYQSGFTLIELLIVIAIIGVLASTLITVLLGAQKRAYDTGAIGCAKSLQTVQSISQIDNKTYLVIGAGAGKLNKSSDGVDQACKQTNIFVADRSNASNLTSNYIIDVWDTRGSKVVTVTPSSVQSDVPGATAFSSTGAGGTNLP